MRIWKVGVGAIIIGLGAATYATTRLNPSLFESSAGAAPAKPPAFVMPVPVTPVIKRTVPIVLDYPARTESIRNVTLQARVSGYVQDQTATDGADVKAGDLLYRIDPRDLQAALDQAKAQLQRDSAALDYARSNESRGSELAKSGYIAKDSIDQRTSTLRQAEAAVASDNAAIRTATLNLSYAEIRAPFAGRLGRNQAPVGTLTNGTGAPLNTLVQLDPIYVTFNPSETDLMALQTARAAGPVTADVMVRGTPAKPRQGEVTFINNSVDRATGTVTARATIANPDFTLLPGQYVQIRIRVGDRPDSLLVPQDALGSSQFGKYVYLVGANQTVDQRPVTLGPTDGGLVSVTGVAEGDQVITGNLQKIGPGSPVKPLPQP